MGYREAAVMYIGYFFSEDGRYQNKMYFHEVRYHERNLMAVAARDKINLNQHINFKPAELVITELMDAYNVSDD